MSIINDALKKTQQNLNPTVDPKAASGAGGNKPQLGDERFSKPPTGTQNDSAAKTNAAFAATASPTPVPSKAKKDDQPRRNRTLPLLLVLLAVGIFFAYKNGYLNEAFFQETFTKLSALLPNKGQPGGMSPQNGTVRPGVMLQMKPTLPKNKDGLVLNGIVDNGEKIVALINNEIYETGDMVKNQQIVEIGSNFVKLSGPSGISIMKIDAQH